MKKETKLKNTQLSKNNKTSMIRSLVAEYLTFVAAAGSQETSVEMRYEDENIWLTQKMMATLYDVTVPEINQHLKRIFSDRELESEATVKQYLIVQTEGERLKSGGSILSDEYFERQLEKVREIRLSERKFYQKITDIYATALD